MKLTDKEILELINKLSENKYQNRYPTIAEVIMWLYEQHNIWIVVDYYTRGIEYIWFYNYKLNDRESMEEGFNSPNEAYQEAIKYILINNIIKS